MIIGRLGARYGSHRCRAKQGASCTGNRAQRHIYTGEFVITRAIAIAAAALLAGAAIPAAAQTEASISLPSSAPSGLFTGTRSERVLMVQVLLDRAHHSPGAIDGMIGSNTRRAIRAFQKANGLQPTGQIDSQLLERLSGGEQLIKSYKVTKEDVDGPFRSVPDSMTRQAKLDKLPYESAAEALAEKFHMTRSFLKALNPGADFASAGTEILVVNGGGQALDAKVQRVEVDKTGNELRAFGADGKLVATYPTTVGSNIHPSPNEKLEVRAIAMNPTYHFDPEGRSWGPDKELTIAAGPNNPVGSVWIDLSKDGYGIHGTPEPKLIGKTSSHGCVRLTNWDAEELAKAIETGAAVAFV